jgi:hypothetical protein
MSEFLPSVWPTTYLSIDSRTDPQTDESLSRTELAVSVSSPGGTDRWSLVLVETEVFFFTTLTTSLLFYTPGPGRDRSVQ